MAPDKHARDYLDGLIRAYMYAEALQNQLKEIGGWEERRDGIDALNLGSWFYRLVFYSFARTVLLEVYKLASAGEKRSLPNWLDYAKKNAATIKPTRYNHQTDVREPVPPAEYQEIIQQHRKQLDQQRSLIDRIKKRRNKALAHADAKYFDEPSELFAHFPIDTEDIDNLLELIAEILRKHHVLLKESDLSMKIHSAHHVGVVLQYSRAWHRARKDYREIMKGNFRPADYEKD